MDYRKFLGRQEVLTLPWLGGAWIDAPGRRLRLSAPPGDGAPGWYRFEIKGREATAVAVADAPTELAERPAVRGHFLDGRLAVEGARLEPLVLLPPDEPARFAPILVRRWHGDGSLIFDRLEFETGVEEEARRQLAEGHGLAQIKGVPATLRAAFGFALVDEVSRALGIRATWAEARRFVVAAADGGRTAAEKGLRELAEERALALREMAELQRRRHEQQLREAIDAERERRLEYARAHARESEERARLALEAAGARVTSVRRLADGQLEVSFDFLGDHFSAIADAATLQVLDSGICLGHPPADELLTLESLPSVLKEAIDGEKLVHLR